MARKLSEEEVGRILEDDYPVYLDYFYVAEDMNGLNHFVVSNIEGTVSDLKRDVENFQFINVKNLRSYTLPIRLKNN